MTGPDTIGQAAQIIFNFLQYIQWGGRQGGGWPFYLIPGMYTYIFFVFMPQGVPIKQVLTYYARRNLQIELKSD
jgi:hypothetical protein